jgi:ABC-2 type transport system permease protein
VSPGTALLIHSFERYRALLLVLAGVLTGFQILVSLAAETLERSNTFRPLLSLVPAPFREAFGPALIALMSFTGIACVGYFHIAVIGTLVGMTIIIATEPAGEIESRFIDLVLARPLARHWIVTRTIILLSGATVWLLFALGAGSVIGILWLAPGEVTRPALQLVAMLTGNLALLLISWGGITLAFAGFARRRSVPGALVGVLAFSSYLVDYLARVWTPARRFAWLSPFHYYRAVEMISGDAMPPADLLVLGGVAVAGFGTAYLLFQRRDL